MPEPEMLFKPTLEKVEDFLARFKQQKHLELGNAADEVWARLLATCLPRHVLLRLQTHVQPGSLAQLTYEQLRSKLVELYDTHEKPLSAPVEFFNRVQKAGESVEEYAAELEYLVMECRGKEWSCESILCDRFVAGLSSRDIQDALLEGGDRANFLEIVKLAKVFAQESVALQPSPTPNSCLELRKNGPEVAQKCCPSRIVEPCSFTSTGVDRGGKQQQQSVAKPATSSLKPSMDHRGHCDPSKSTTMQDHLQTRLQKEGLSQRARCLSSRASFRASDVEIEFCRQDQLKPKPAVKDLVFGVNFTDHMLEVEWTEKDGWGKPRISPFHNFQMHPAAKVLHYATELFEGMKSYRTADGDIKMFRPDMNMKRMIRTAERASLPTFDPQELISLMKRLVAIDQEWVPHAESSSLYIRPTIIAHEEVLKVEQPRKALLFVILSPTGPYFTSGYNPVSLLADPAYVRAWPGGCGDAKMGSNYAPTLAVQKEAMRRGHAQVLWLFGPEHRITEVGAMNIMILLDKGNGERELVTPPLDGLILPGVTRASLLDLARSWQEFEVNERDITMGELVDHCNHGRVLEMFGCGTAAVVCPVGEISYMGKTLTIPTMQHEKPLTTRFYDAITDIQYGRTPHPWAVSIQEEALRRDSAV